MRERTGPRIRALLPTMTGAVLLMSVVSPAPASAGVAGCAYDEDTHVLHVTMSGASAAVIDREQGRIEVNDAPCFGGILTSVATVTNTKRIAISGDGGNQSVAFFLYNGLLKPGFGDEPGDSDEVEITATLGGGTDGFFIAGTNNRDRIRAGAKNGAIKINLNAGESTGVDADVTVRDAENVSISGNEGNDTLAATGGLGTGQAMTLAIRLTGSRGNDTLTGGDGNDTLVETAPAMIPENDIDVAQGGAGADTIQVNDFDALDTARGGKGVDTCSSDPGDTVTGC